MKRKLNLKRIFLLIIVLVVCAFVMYFVKSTVRKSSARDVEFEIPMGASTNKIAQVLKENDLIDSIFFFKVETKLKGYGGKYRYGLYKMNTSMSSDEIMHILSTEGATKNTVSVTIPEGYTIKQIGQKLEEAKLFTKEEFYDECKNGTFDFKFLDKNAKGDYYLEGFLFPNTYEFYDDATPNDVITIMLKAFDDNINDEDYLKAEKLGYSFRDVITVASIIEREVKEPTERPMVAGVVYNRLKKNMALQMCSTIQYILGEQHDKLYDVDLQIDSPYNTYMYPGLPIGPISNPGKASIDAALNPVSHDYYYFVLMDEKTGKHYFSKTFEEHSTAKSKYIK